MVKTVKEFGFLILEDCRAENYKGWSVQENEIYGYEEFIQDAVKKTFNHKELVATHAVGASKCHIKKLNESQFIKEDKKTCVLWCEIIEHLQDGICLFKIEDYLFKTKDDCKTKSQEGVKDYDHALNLFKQTNLNIDLSIIGVYSDSVKKLFRRGIADCFIEDSKGITCFILGKQLRTEPLVV